MKKWTYDSKVGSCVEYIYGGCFGTKNLFNTKEECEGRCQTSKQVSFLCSAPILNRFLVAIRITRVKSVNGPIPLSKTGLLFLLNQGNVLFLSNRWRPRRLLTSAPCRSSKDPAGPSSSSSPTTRTPIDARSLPMEVCLAPRKKS